MTGITKKEREKRLALEKETERQEELRRQFMEKAREVQRYINHVERFGSHV